MLNSREVHCVTILQAAASSTLGIVIKTSDPVKARTSLYKVRNKLQDPELECLMIRVSPDNSEGELWILKKGVQQTVVLGKLQ